MRVLIIGASGLVGYNCYKYFKEQHNIEVLGTHRTLETAFTIKFDASNFGENEKRIFEEFRPEVIIHCGGLTNVDECELNPERSLIENVQSTNNLIEVSHIYDSKIVYISTDYVFDGEHGPYKENDKPNPINTYGKHKLCSEKLIQESGLEHLIIRITNVYGKEFRNKNFVSRILKNPETLTEMCLPVDQYATPIDAFDVARAIYLLIFNLKNGIYHFASSDFYNRYQLAKQVNRIHENSNWLFKPITTQASNQKAKRPLFGGLICAKFLNEFPDFNFTTIKDIKK